MGKGSTPRPILVGTNTYDTNWNRVFRKAEKQMKLVYVAGPYRADTHWQMKENIYRAEAVGVLVARAGAFPVIPHMNTAFWSGAVEDEKFFLDGTLELLKRCDAIVVLPNGEQSSGTRGEVMYARKVNMPLLQLGDHYNFEDISLFVQDSVLRRLVDIETAELKTEPEAGGSIRA